MGHWTNLTPPIRGGIYSTTSDEDTSDGSDFGDLSDASTLCTRTTSLDIDYEKVDEGLRERSRLESELDGQQDGHLQVPSNRRKRGPQQTPILITPEAYIEKAMQSEIDDNLRDYPSLDETTQREISSAYRELHQQIKDGGHYECRYSEYAKEVTRYLIIFASFYTALRSGWYLTSAAFLGLFWVSFMSCFNTDRSDILIASDNVFSTRCRASRHHSQLGRRQSHWSVHCRLLLWAVNRMVEIQSQCASSDHKSSCMSNP